MMRYLRSLRWHARAGLCCLAAVAAAAATVGAASAPGAAQAASTPPACSRAQQQPAAGPTTVTTIGQAYYCVFAHYYSGPALDDRVLLAGAFAGLTQELNRLGTDQPDATMPALTGSRDSDWAAFAAVYSRVIGKVPPRDVQRVAAAALTGMAAALNDDHARWRYPSPQPPGATDSDIYGLGINTSPNAGVAKNAPGETLPPAVVTSVDPGSPAARAGVRPGDTIASVNGAPPFPDGMLSPGVFYLLNQAYPQHQTLRVTVRWPVTGATRTVTITPALYWAPVPMTSKLLDGDIGYVQLSQFYPGGTSQVLAAVKSLEKTATLRGLILDVRGNGGGSPAEDPLLPGAFEHGTAYAYACAIAGTCTADYPDASTPLLHLPLVVLTDRNCLSACEAFSAAVKDLHLGTLIGTRTAGVVAGPGLAWALDDGSTLGLPAMHDLGADHELIDGIGVAPDYYIPRTAGDLAAGHDPDIAKALALFKA